MAYTHISTNLFPHAKSIVGDIVEGNIASVHLKECVSGFGPQKCVECGGLSGKKRERRGGLFGILEEGSWESFLEEKIEEKREKNVSEEERVIYE